MKCPRCNSRGRGGETSKWQWVNSKLVSFRSGFRIHKLNRFNSQGRGGRTAKWQWVNSKLVSFQSGFRIHKLNFEIMSWISKSFRNDPPTWCSCFQMAITSSFQLQFSHHIKRWTPNFPSFKTIYSMYIMDSTKSSKFVLKVRIYNAIRFLSSKFPCNQILLHASFPMLPCLLSYSIMVISHLPNAFYPRLAFPYGP